jgi:Tfp pilus assembly protein PilE
VSIVRIRRALKDDQGVSLAELIVYSIVSILLLTMVGGFFAAVAKGTQASAVADVNTRQMSTAMSTMVQYLHAATTYPVANQTNPSPAIVSASATDLTFYAYVNLQSTAAQPVEVRYYIDPVTHDLKEQQWSSTCSPTTGYCTFSSTVTKQFDLGGPVASPTSDNTPLFTYFSSATTNPLTQIPLNTTTKLIDTANLGNIVYIGINLEWGSTTPGSGGDGHASTVVGLLNLGQSGAQ